MTPDTLQKRKHRPHDSAVTHVAGKSEFIDDRPWQRGELLVGFLFAEVPKGTLNSIDISEALEIEGVVDIYTHKDLCLLHTKTLRALNPKSVFIFMSGVYLQRTSEPAPR